LIAKKEIQRRLPLTSRPIPGISTATSSTTPATNRYGAARCQSRIGICTTAAAAAMPNRTNAPWRVRKYVLR
jgi:hypothetical protein